MDLKTFVENGYKIIKHVPIVHSYELKCGSFTVKT